MNSRSMRVAMEDLGLAHLCVVYPGRHVFPLEEWITAIPVASLSEPPVFLKAKAAPSAGAQELVEQGRCARSGSPLGR